MDLAADRQRQGPSDARDAPESVVAPGAVLLGSLLEVKLHVFDELVVMLDLGEIDLHALAGIRLIEGVGDTFAR